METINVTAAVQAAKQLNATVASLKARKAELVEQIAKLEESTQLLYRLPLRRSEAKDFILQTIDKVGAEFPGAAKWNHIFSGFAFPKGDRPKQRDKVDLNPATYERSEKAICLQDLDAISKGNRSRVMGVEWVANFFSGAGDLDAMDARRVYFFFGDIIKEKIEKHFDQLFPELERLPFSGVKPGLPSIEQRRTDIENNSQNIDKLSEELERIDGQLKELADASMPPAVGPGGKL